ncbi:hypothetical protein QBC34DRAFT_313847 [Podospora aff. communis PSN243]|uniref:Rhodopsin domain-containing protein n=1 Tax=Podospora aff. communis PSN243 TaxID=3040156 RepID=A0AAV9FZM8_9PEZI|nr:hypothetical protein QBC34DRAFT_313847 [Podospora aff. communis PSN243]
MDEFTTEAFTLLGVGLLFIGLRSYVRITTVGWKGLQADDYLMWVAAAAYSAETALAYTVGAYWKGLANNNMTEKQRAALDPNSEEWLLRVNGSKTQVAGWSVYTFLLWVIKAAMCSFYLRLTEGLEFRMRIYAGFGLIVSTWIAVLFSILFGCGADFQKNWQIHPDPGNFCQPAISKVDIFVTLILNVITDIYLMSIPIPMLWRASLRPVKKAGLILLFSGGIFVMIAGILRCILILKDQVNGAQQAGSWAVRETFVAVITSNLPMIFPLVNRWGKPLLGSLRTLGSTAGKLSGMSRTHDSKPGVFRLENKNPRRGMGPRSVHPITEFTLSGSEEHIVNQNQQQPESENPPQSTQQSRLEGAETSGSGSGSGSDVDLELGHSNGGILKETSLQVTEMRKSRSDLDSGDDRNIGDYYLVEQARRSAEYERDRKHHPNVITNKAKRSSINFSRVRRAQ